MTSLQQQCLQQQESQANTADASVVSMLYLLGLVFASIPTSASSSFGFTISLLSRLVYCASLADVLRSKFEDISRVLLGLLEAGANAEDAHIARPVLLCLGNVLAALDVPTLAHHSVLPMFQVLDSVNFCPIWSTLEGRQFSLGCFPSSSFSSQALLIYSVDPRPKVRRVAQQGAASVVQGIRGHQLTRPSLLSLLRSPVVKLFVSFFSFPFLLRVP